MSRQPVISVMDRVMVKPSTRGERMRYATVRSIQEIKSLSGIYYVVAADYTDEISFHKLSELELVVNSGTLRVTVGHIVNVKSAKCRGVIRYIGPTNFKADFIWYGIQLEEANGKNNGSVDGINYFQCAPKLGLFVKDGKIEIIPRFKKLTKRKSKKKKKKFDVPLKFAMIKMQNVKINLFIQVTNSNRKIAQAFLDRKDWNIDAAVLLFHEIDAKISKKMDVEKSCKRSDKKASTDTGGNDEAVVYKAYKATTWTRPRKPFKYQLFN